MFKFLSETSKVSSTRVTLFLGTICVCILCLSIATYVAINAYKCNVIDWSGIAIFLSSISAFVGTLLYGKVQQKKVELYENTKSVTDSSLSAIGSIKHTEMSGQSELKK